MEYEFFFSYTRANNDAYLQRFVDDLSNAVRGLLGRKMDAPVGFFDQHDIELGEDWDATIVEALQTSKVFLAITSPAYFKSEYCGKELALFRRRYAESVAKGKPLPPLIKPIVWVEYSIDDVPVQLRQGQLTRGDPTALPNTKGIKHILRRLQDHNTLYADFVDDLASEIIAAGEGFPIDRLPRVPKLDAVVSLFDSPSSVKPGAAIAPIRVPSGPKHVRFIYVAADPQQFGDERAPDPYMESGGSDWKPYFPDDKTRVHRLVQNFVSNDELDFTSDEVHFGPTLIDEIKSAWELRQIVVLIVDGWSVHRDAQFQQLLSELDGRLDYHWCVLVPWNELDGDSVKLRKQIKSTISQTFHRHANLARNELFYRDNITSPAQLKEALSEVLTRLKEEIKKQAPVDMPVPTGPSRPILSGPAVKG